MKYSFIITAYKEEKTIGKAIESILANNILDSELIVIAPDKPTLDKAKEFSKKNKSIRTLTDPGKGKPNALNIAVKEAKGEILILTDGDVYVDKDSLKRLLAPFSDIKIGAVSGHPVSLNKKDNLLGYWSYVLTEVADLRRRKAISEDKRLFCSGYLFAIRKRLFPHLDEEILSEDGLISHHVYQKGLKIGYSDKSFVYIKYPTTFSDWITQKRRSAGGYNQIKKLTNTEIRSFKKESLGAFSLFRYVTKTKEFFWILLLFVARVYLWMLIYRDINIRKKSHQEIWKRVETTK